MKSGRCFPLLFPMLLASIALLLSSCRLRQLSPRFEPDYDNSSGFILDYAVGDRFETIKPMLLTRPVGTWLDLSMPGIGAPSIEQYENDPSRFRRVIKLVPSGTPFVLVGIKRGGDYSAVNYIQFEGEDEWVCVYLEEYVDVGGKTYKRYNREYFRKL